MENYDLPIAGRSSRLINSLVDGTIIGFLSVLLSFGYVFFGNMATLSDNEIKEQFALFYIITYFVIFFGYYFFMESRFQRTLGKFITKTKVVTEDGEKPKYSRIALRTICRLFPFDYLTYLVSTNGFHDFIAKTKVVKWYA